MEDKTPLPTTPPPAARTADALRQLHDRARTTLSAQRERMKRLEAQLTEQLDSITDTLAAQLAEHGEQADQVRSSVIDVEQFRNELEQARAEWREERTKSEAEAAERAEQLNALQAELDARQQALDDRSTALNHQERELRQRQELLDAQTLQCAEQHAQLTATESALDQKRADLAACEQALHSNQAALTAERESLQQERDTLTTEREALSTEHESLQSDRAALEAERAAIAEQLKSITVAKQATDNELQSRLASLEQQLATERSAWECERTSVDEQRRLLARERDELATALDSARTELAAARELAGAGGERDELQQKFDLAIDDLQRLRSHVAELEQELTSRPAVDETDSVELVHLRAERDAMAERIAELERQPAAPEDAESAQERADLQRRFELAVEDVRDLKKKNAQLEARLADVAVHVPAAATGGGSNWEAMKKQMLANLEGEGDDGDEERQAERATIESTIRITDEALERKDREIKELKSRLAESAHAVPDETEAMRQLIDADEVIAEHRARIAKIEQEITDKLRAAELEVSVERAKLAREKVQLADLRAEIEAHRPVEQAASSGGVQQPKRRWLSKLGLSGEDGT